MATTLSMSKDELMERAQQQMQRHLKVPLWSTQQQVALTCRILSAQGHDSGLAGQITARVDGAEHFVTQRLGLGFDEVRTSNLLVVDEDLNVIEGDGMPNPANRFHVWIYRARPDVRCIIHTHPLHASALSMLERPLEIAHMDTCVLYDDVAFLKSWPGVPVGNAEGETISAALGSKRAILLAHHGLLVAGGSVEEACVVAIQFERAAKLQLLAEAAGPIQPIDPSLGREAHDWILQGKRSQASFYYYARRMLVEQPDCLE
jgi:L-fuculose-phosphate aldolase